MPYFNRIAPSRAVSGTSCQSDARRLSVINLRSPWWPDPDYRTRAQWTH